MIIRLAQRQFPSLWRRGDWRALMAATLIMTALITLLSTTAQQLQFRLGQRSAELLGASLVLNSSRPIPPAYSAQLTELGARHSEVIQFSTMAEANDQLLLSSVRALLPPYPLQGELVTVPVTTQGTLPEAGTAWVEASVLERLGIQVGDTLQIGYSNLHVTHTLIASPDRGSGFGSFNPHILINRADLEPSGVLAPGSRVSYRLLIDGTPEQRTQAETILTPQLASWERLLSASTEQPMTRNAMSNAANYLKLSAVCALILGAAAIFMSLKRFAFAQQRRTALLISLGLSRRQLLQLFLLLLSAGWLAAASAGTLLGWGLHHWLMALLGDLLPQPRPSVALANLLAGALISAAIIIVIGLTLLIPLSRIAVNTLLNSQATKPAALPRLSWVLLSLVLLLIVVLFTGQWQAAALLTVAILGAGVIAGALSQWLLNAGNFVLQRMSGHLRLLTLRLRQQRFWHRLQGGILALILSLMASLILTRGALVDDWQSQLPTETPNRFLINIQPWEVADVNLWLSQQQLEAILYPMIRGRVVSVNNQPVDEVFSAEQRQHNTLNRELNLTWSDTLPDHNTLLEGNPALNPGDISIESTMAQALGLTLGDTLGFQIGSQTVSGKISSVRAVEWASFRPNFYIIFAPGSLDNLPATYMTSFKTQATAEQDRALIQQFPTISVINIDQLLAQAQTLLQKLSDSAGLILLLTLLSGLVLVITTLLQDLKQRRFETALLRTMGASAQQTQQLDRAESLLLGGSCGLVAAALTELFVWTIYQRMALPTGLHPTLWLGLPLAATLLFAGAGQLTRRRLRLGDAYQLLRQGAD